MNINLESPDQPDVVALIAELDAYQDGLYPPESRHALDLGVLVQPHVLFAVARDEPGRAVGCAAVVLDARAGELKRMYVSPAVRGRGVGRRLIDLLQHEALQRGCRALRLETGPYQPEALGLYAACGFERRGPFGSYAEDPMSVFMEKLLVTEHAAGPA